MANRVENAQSNPDATDVLYSTTDGDATSHIYPTIRKYGFFKPYGKGNKNETK